MNLLPKNEPVLMTLEGYSSFMQNLASVEWGNVTESAPTDERKREPLTVVRLYGTMLRGMSPRVKKILAYYEMPYVDTLDTIQELEALKNDDAVKVVVLDINSPGGRVTGTPELAACVCELAKKKHVYAFTGDLACSAAYWVASQCDAIYAAPSAQLGSIGVLLPLLDVKGAYDKAGLKMDALSAGKYKTTGLEGTSLTEEQRELLQNKINDHWARFREAVNMRRKIAPEHMEGQSFIGAEAVEIGLADANVNTLEELEAKLMKRHRL